MEGRVVVTPQYRPSSEGGGRIYLTVRNEGATMVPVLAVDIGVVLQGPVKEPLTFPAGFERRGSRRISVGPERARQEATLQIRRLFWDRRPLLPGLEEPLTNEAIVIPVLDDLLFRLVTAQVTTPNRRADPQAWQIDTVGLRPQMKEIPPTWAVFLEDSEVPWSPNDERGR
jgi:hypothetical protein